MAPSTSEYTKLTPTLPLRRRTTRTLRLHYRDEHAEVKCQATIWLALALHRTDARLVYARSMPKMQLHLGLRRRIAAVASQAFAQVWTTAARASHSRMKDLTAIFKNFEITPLADHHPNGAGRHSVCHTFSWPMNLMFSKTPYPSRLPGRSTLWPAKRDAWFEVYCLPACTSCSDWRSFSPADVGSQLYVNSCNRFDLAELTRRLLEGSMRIALSSVALAAMTVSSMAQSTAPSPPQKSYSGATADFAGAGKPGEWTSQARDYANTRFSPLDQINAANVGKLKVAWTFSDGTQYGHEGAPLVVGDTMYVVTPYPNTAYALDLSKPGPSIKWKFDPNPSPQAIGKACCDAVIRGWAYADGKLIYNMLDDHTVAVDANTGKQVWRTAMDKVSHGVTMTQSAFAADGKVFVGNSGGELGVNGWLAALDLGTGKELWRAHAVGPDSDVRIDATFKPFYDWMKGKNLGVKTWPPNAWNTGAGASWGFVSYDEKTKTIYYGTSNPGPRVPVQRPGDNLWTSAMFARDPDSGMAK